MTTATQEKDTRLAIDGGPKAFPAARGKHQPKIGVDEFLSIARRFGFSAQALERIQSAVSNDDLPAGGPNLGKYATANPKPAVGLQYEELACKVFGAKFALGVSSGTGALHSAMVAVGAGPGKEVIVPATGFMATAAAVAVTGATPVFCDIDTSMQMDPRKIEECITADTVAIAPTHHWGMVADMDPILAVARKHNLRVVEDCAQSPGARYRGRCVGTLGDIGCFSISAYKIIGGGESGLILTSDARLFDRVNQLAECGGLWRTDRFAPERYEGELFVGTNYRMSELESAVNMVQLQKLEGIVTRTRTNYLRVVNRLKRCRQIQPQTINDRQGLIGYQIRFFPATHELSSRIANALRAEGVGARTRGPAAKPDWHLAPEMFPLMRNLKPHSRHDRCPVGDDLYHREVTVGIDQWWTPQDCDDYADAMNKVFAACCTEDPAAPAWI